MGDGRRIGSFLLPIPYDPSPTPSFRPEWRNLFFVRSKCDLTLHVAELFGAFAVADAKHVHAADMAVAPGVAPARGAAVAAGEQLFQLEMRAGRSAEESFPKPTYRRLSGEALPIREWRR